MLTMTSNYEGGDDGKTRCDASESISRRDIRGTGEEKVGGLETREKVDRREVCSGNCEVTRKTRIVALYHKANTTYPYLLPFTIHNLDDGSPSLMMIPLTFPAAFL